MSEYALECMGAVSLCVYQGALLSRFCLLLPVGTCFEVVRLRVVSVSYQYSGFRGTCVV